MAPTRYSRRNNSWCEACFMWIKLCRLQWLQVQQTKHAGVLLHYSRDLCHYRSPMKSPELARIVSKLGRSLDPLFGFLCTQQFFPYFEGRWFLGYIMIHLFWHSMPILLLPWKSVAWFFKASSPQRDLRTLFKDSLRMDDIFHSCIHTWL
jgi:hypothetical protein